jgi:hypothetical protein
MFFEQTVSFSHPALLWQLGLHFVVILSFELTKSFLVMPALRKFQARSRKSISESTREVLDMTIKYKWASVIIEFWCSLRATTWAMVAEGAALS